MRASMISCFTLFLIFLFIPVPQIIAQHIDNSVTNGFHLRNLGPYNTGGRISDVAIDPKNKSIWFVAVASGNVWRTKNAGTTWTPIFENYGSYSIGTVVIDPKDSNIIWVGTGENNAQRSVSKGDGVYKSIDGGNTWNHMGLKTSEHIGKIMIDPRNSDIVYVAAQGSVWTSGGERGLYKTIDGGQHWERTLDISENTGISDIILDPRNPDILLVSSYQRRRHPGVLVAGGPDGGIWKTTDAGTHWSKLSSGLPGGDLGRIGLAISPQQPDVCYALIAGTADTKGFYRSSNLGEHWTKMSSYMVNDAQYYMELFPDPHQFDKVYSVQTIMQVTEDGGKTFANVNNKNMHVDHHEVVFDPDDPDHLWIGNDGGLYETWDGCKTYRFFDNLPLTQFYRVGIDNDLPFYNVYGGTQDNATLGGPSQTINTQGIKNSDWFVTTGGDGFQTRVDPEDPNIVYSQSQYGYLVRYDKKSKQRMRIQPKPGAGEAPFKWHWNAPLLISPHNKNRLYFAAERVFKSDDRGDSWDAISGDLSLDRDRNRMKVMDKVWGVDAIFKNVWTSPMGTIVAMDESPIKEGLLYAGTDDGQIHATQNGGKDWQLLPPMSGVPTNTFVADIHSSRTDAHTVYVVYNNHKFGDYKPYVYVSKDAGQTWKAIIGNLPKGEYLWSIYQDHINPDLLFLGAEYGLYFSVDGGNHWNKFNKGIPTIAIRDLEIQKRESDLVAASFGRGFYILDDYTPLRTLNAEVLQQDAHLFPIAPALQYVESSVGGRAWGDGFVTSPNPDFGATITYTIKSGEMTMKQKRLKSEKEKASADQPVYYPDWEDLASEREERKPEVVISIYEDHGANARSPRMEIQRITGPTKKGLNRINWDLKNADGIKVKPGKYKATIAKIVNGQWVDLNLEQSFEVNQLENASMASTNPEERQVFYTKVSQLRKKANKSQEVLTNLRKDIKMISDQAADLPNINPETYQQLHRIAKQLRHFNYTMQGNRLMTEKMELIAPSIMARLRNVGLGTGDSSDPTGTHKEDYRIASQEYSDLAKAYNNFLTEEVLLLKSSLMKAGITTRITSDKFLIE